jgi:hypothetical protein
MLSPRSTSKTTNTVWFLQTLYDLGKQTEGYDCDESKQLTKWDEANEFDFPIIGAASTQAHKIIGSTYNPKKWGVADVGHLENHPDVGKSVCRVADLAVINCAPTGPDYERLIDLPMRDPVNGFLDGTATYRPNGEEIPAVVLMTRVKARTTSTERDARSLLKDQGYLVLDAAIPIEERYTKTGQGMVVDPKVGTDQRAAHVDVIHEIEERFGWKDI